jgi:hypothetical protein
MLRTTSNSMPSTPRRRRGRQLIMAFTALAAFSTVASTAQAQTPQNPYAGLANYAAGYTTNGNDVPQGGDRYQPGYAGFADYARGYQATHPAAFGAKHGPAVASTARGRTNHRYTSVIRSAPVSTAGGYPSPGGTAVLVATWTSSLYGSGALVDRVTITGHPNATTFTYRGTEVGFVALGTFRDTFTGTATVQPNGSQNLVANGRITGGTGALRGARGSFKFTGSTAPGSSVVNGRSAGTISY